MKIEPTRLTGALILTPARFGDDRGWFCESFSAARMAAAGLPVDWVQDNHSHSVRRGTLRGLHYQAPPAAQDKLVRCTRGAVRDVIVDIREGSPSQGQWQAFELTEEGGEQLFIPKGFLHGFLTLTDGAEVQYKCTAPYAPACDRSVRWDDDDLGIDWGLGGAAPILSPKDAAAPRLAEAPSPFVYGTGA